MGKRDGMIAGNLSGPEEEKKLRYKPCLHHFMKQMLFKVTVMSKSM